MAARQGLAARQETRAPGIFGLLGGWAAYRRRQPTVARVAGSHLPGVALAPVRLDCGRSSLATPRWPPSGSTAGCALVSPTPPQGGSDTEPNGEG